MLRESRLPRILSVLTVFLFGPRTKRFLLVFGSIRNSNLDPSTAGIPRLLKMRILAHKKDTGVMGSQMFVKEHADAAEIVSHGG